MFLAASQVSLAQITGKVIDAETKDPLPGATVVLKGTQTGEITGFDGSFRLNATEGQTLQVSFIGFETVEVAVEVSVHQISLLVPV